MPISKKSASGAASAGKGDRQSAIEDVVGQLATVTAEFYERYHPADVTERFLVDTLAHNEWRLRNLRQVESALWKRESGSAGPSLKRIQRIIKWSERNYRNALRELEAIRSEGPRPIDKIGPEPIRAFDASFQSILKQ